MATIPAKVREQESETLKRLYAERTTLQHGEFATSTGLPSAAMVWQYLNDHRPLNLTAAAQFARGLNIRIEQFSTRLATEARFIADVVQKPGDRRTQQNLRVAEPPSELARRYTDLKWPFQSIDPLRVARLDPHQRGVLEGILLRTVIDFEAGHPLRLIK